MMAGLSSLHLQTLPLGPEFQLFVNLFIDFEETRSGLVPKGIQSEVKNMVYFLRKVCAFSAFQDLM